MAYQYNNNGSGRTYVEWNSGRGNSGKKLQAIPPITNTANGKRYFSSIDAELYFGDIFIDEVTNIAWSIQQQAVPIYGYNSYTFDDIAVGSRIIQGQFAINFTERNYLTKLQNSSGFQKIARRIYGEDKPVSETDAGKIYSDFRQRLHLPMWDKGFDIVIGFGEDPKSGNVNTYGTYLVLNCVQITGSTIQLDFNGDPIQEVYTFMARDIKETFSDATEANPSSVTSEKINNSGSTEDLNLTGVLDLTKNKINISSPLSITFADGATLQLTGNFNDKTLDLLMELTAVKNTLSYALKTDFVSAFKKEKKDSVEIYAVLKGQYTTSSNSTTSKIKTVDIQTNVKLLIKK